MKKIKGGIVIVLTLLMNNVVFSQATATFDAGQTFSTYEYTDSSGKIPDFKGKISGCFGLGFQYFTNSGAFIKAGVGMRKGGASLDYSGINVEWSTQYVDYNLGIGYMLNKWRVKPYISVSGFYASMIQGEQTIGTTHLDIINDHLMSKNDFGVYVIPGIRVAINNTISVYGEYRYIMALRNLELTSGEKSYNRGFSLNLGVAISFIHYKYISSK